MNRFKKYIFLCFLGGLALSSCSDKENSDGDTPSGIENMEYKAEKIKLKIKYAANSNTEFRKEIWKYNEKKQLTGYESHEDGQLIEKHFNFKYSNEENNFIQTYNKEYYFNNVAYVKETIKTTFKDSVGGKILSSEVKGKDKTTVTKYSYNESGLLIGVEILCNGEIERSQTAYEYSDKACTYIEGYKSGSSWETKKHELKYANIYYSILSQESIYKPNHNDIIDECTKYSYDEHGQLIAVNAYYYKKDNTDKWNDTYIETLSYKLSNFVYTSNGVTYTKENFIDESDSGKVEETYLD